MTGERGAEAGAGFAGTGALLWLARRRLRARVRHFVRGCKRPLRLVLSLLCVAGITLVALAPGDKAPRDQGLQAGGVHALGTFLLLLPLVSVWTSVRQGVLAFRPEEVHFLFPAPVTSRALLLGHLVSTLGKSLSGAFLFALFFRPGGAALPAIVLGYAVYIMFCVLLQVSVDLTCLRWSPAVRRRAARAVLAAMLVLLAGSVALAWQQDGRAWDGWRSVRHATAVMRPFATVISGGTLPGSLPYGTGLLLALGAIALLAWRVLRFRGDVREAAHGASLVHAKALAAVRAGRVFHDAPREDVAGLLPMLPHLRGAGVHAWRQLTVLRRSRKSYALLLVMTLAAGAATRVSWAAEPVITPLAMLAVLAFAGPMFVQCDFRSDYDCLPWLRTLPCKPGVLAAGQMLASSLVLFALQVLLTGWSLLVCSPEQRLACFAAYLLLPVFNLLQLSVWNGAHLISPLRLGGEQGAPGAMAVLRMYLVMFSVLGVIAVALLLAGLVGAGTWHGLPLLGVSGTAVRRTCAFLAGYGALALVTALCVWCVGRLFLRVDCSRDLAD
ncbi:MAG TPA: putative ABC exporter domain-containing protein [Planctomycetota bacterium]|nr:putative ABC exporter domain-containing protein [Planctomycetota bacterium]